MIGNYLCGKVSYAYVIFSCSKLFPLDKLQNNNYKKIIVFHSIMTIFIFSFHSIMTCIDDAENVYNYSNLGMVYAYNYRKRTQSI